MDEVSELEFETEIDFGCEHTCESVGEAGDCGTECPVYLYGDCTIEEEIDAIDYDLMGEEEFEDLQRIRTNKMFDKAMGILEKK